MHATLRLRLSTAVVQSPMCAEPVHVVSLINHNELQSVRLTTKRHVHSMYRTSLADVAAVARLTALGVTLKRLAFFSTGGTPPMGDCTAEERGVTFSPNGDVVVVGRVVGGWMGGNESTAFTGT